MRVKIYDDNDNWLKWGKLVEEWVTKPGAKRPTTVGELRAALDEAKIAADVDGQDNRPVEIRNYSNNAAANQPLEINLPTADMINQRKADMKLEGTYELPNFYDLAYDKGVRARLSPQLKEEFRLRRIAEYSVNECC